MNSQSCHKKKQCKRNSLDRAFDITMSWGDTFSTTVKNTAAQHMFGPNVLACNLSTYLSVKQANEHAAQFRNVASRSIRMLVFERTNHESTGNSEDSKETPERAVSLQSAIKSASVVKTKLCAISGSYFQKSSGSRFVAISHRKSARFPLGRQVHHAPRCRHYCYHRCLRAAPLGTLSRGGLQIFLQIE